MVGLDFSENAVRFCNDKYNVEGLSFEGGNAESLPFTDNSFDVVLNVESSHCYSSMNAFLAQVKRVLREGGYFLMADFRRKEALEDLRESLNESGLTLIKETDITQNILEAMELDDDVLELAAHLGLDRFGAMGTSGGGPPVIACAYRLKDHLDFAAVFGSAAPIYTDPIASKELSAFDRITANMSVKLPRWLFVFLMGLMISTFKNINTSDRYKKIFGSLLCDADLEIVDSEPIFVPVMMTSIMEAFRQGAGGPADDTVAIVKDWGFHLTEIDFPVVLVHGTEDKHVPYSFSEYMRAEIPNSKLVPLEGEGHYTHFINPARSFDIIEGIYPEG